MRFGGASSSVFSLRESDPLGPWLFAVMVFLASIFAVMALISGQVLTQWRAGLEGGLTVVIPPDFDRSMEETQSLTDVILRTTMKTPGVQWAELIEWPDVATLMQPWLSSSLEVGELAVPTMFDVTAQPGVLTARLAQTLTERLAPLVDGVTVDAHTLWEEQISSVLGSLQWGSAVIAMMVILSAMVVITLVTMGNLSQSTTTVEVMHLVGARDRFIARGFGGVMTRLALRGGTLGGLLTLSVLGGVHLLLRASAPDLSLLINPLNNPWIGVVLFGVVVVMILLSRELAIRLVLRRLHSQDPWR